MTDKFAMAILYVRKQWRPVSFGLYAGVPLGIIIGQFV